MIMELVVINKEVEAAKAKFMIFTEQTTKLCDEAAAIAISDDKTAHHAITLGGIAKAITKEIETRRKETIADATAFIAGVNAFCKTITEPLKEAETAVKTKAGDYQIAADRERQRLEDIAKKEAEELQENLRRETAEANRKAAEAAMLLAEEETRQRLAKEAEEQALRDKDEETRRKLIAFENETSEEELAAEAKRLAEIAAANKAKADAEAEATINEAREAARIKAESVALAAPVILTPIISQKQPIRTESGTTSYQVKTYKFEIVNANIVPLEYLIPDEKKIKSAIDAGLRYIPGINIYEHMETRFRNSGR
jgi:hypothetical protein